MTRRERGTGGAAVKCGRQVKGKDLFFGEGDSRSELHARDQFNKYTEDN